MSAAAFKDRLRVDLTTAMRARDRETAKVLREMIATLDNAEAVEASPEQMREGFRKLGDPAGEVSRKVLGEAEIAQILDTEVASRLAIAADYRKMGQEDEARRLEEAARIIAAYRKD